MNHLGGGKLAMILKDKQCRFHKGLLGSIFKLKEFKRYIIKNVYPKYVYQRARI